MIRTIQIAGLVLLTALAVAAPVRAQDQWWDRPEAPPDADAGAGTETGPGTGTETGPGTGTGTGTETGTETGPGTETGTGTGVGADPDAEAPEVLDPDNFDNPEGQDLGDITGAPILGGLDTTWRWQQVLSSPRIGARLTAVSVDPRNPNRIFVGTEEGTIVRSQDGGITWRELEMDPFVTTRRSIAPRSPGLPTLGSRVLGGLTLRAFPPGQARPVDIAVFPFVRQPQLETLSTPFVNGRYIKTFVISPPTGGVTLLRDAVTDRATTPVSRIAVCTGATYPLMVATRNELLGSTDGGLTYVRLLRLPGRILIKQIACSTRDPMQVMVASSFGMYRSRDGGITWDPDLTSRPGNPAADVAFGPGPDGEERAYVATASRVYAGNPDSDSGLDFIYPDFNNSSTAPWDTVYWIETTADGHVWIATRDGVRASFDMGSNWEVIGRTLLSRQQSWQITVGVNEAGGRRVAVLVRDCPNRCRQSLVYASDDNGQTWFPFFQGATRRNLNQMAAAPAAPGIPPRWWVVTGGELWATVPGGSQQSADVDTRSQRWARRELQSAPDMDTVIDSLLDALQLNRRQIDGMFSAIRFRNMAPRLQVEFFYEVNNFSRVEDVTRSGVLDTRFEENSSRTGSWEIRGWLEWRLGSMAYTERELPPTRNHLYTLRRQVAFIAEDAWHERTLLLQRIARGMSDRLQVEILKERITVLETVIETWLRQPLSSLPRGRMRIEEIER